MPRTFGAGHALADHLRLTVRDAEENDRLIVAATAFAAEADEDPERGNGAERAEDLDGATNGAPQEAAERAERLEGATNGAAHDVAAERPEGLEGTRNAARHDPAVQATDPATEIAR